jgi:esterase/lipase superfamily enzyme
MQIVVLASGCATRQLMPTPNLYANGQAPLYDRLAPDLESNRVELVYVTDRVPEHDEAGRLRYGVGRSPSAAFGSADVHIGEGVPWDEIVQLSKSRERKRRLPMKVAGVEEWGRFPATPYPTQGKGASLVIDPDVAAEGLRVAEVLRELLAAKLESTPSKRVLIFVHGYNNGFDDAAITLAESWHYLGREGVPVLYTWPAGHGGSKGYGYDRESGEFTIYHFKQLMKTLASFPEVERIDLIAHSRGTDVTTSGLRELFIESRAAGRSPREEFGIANLVLAAPDLDFQVILQRISAEQLAAGVEQLTLYTSQGDKALGAAEALFDSVTRLGRIQPKDLDEKLTQTLENVGNLDFVEYRGSSDVIGHGYFHNSPAVSSDLVLVLRYDRSAGAQNGRPLRFVAPHFWYLTDSYPETLDPVTRSAR